MTTEYPTLTALMAGREPGSVKVRTPAYKPGEWERPLRRNGLIWSVAGEDGRVYDTTDDGPWLIVSEDSPALDTLRLEIAARVLAGLHASEFSGEDCEWSKRHAYALGEADALIKEARK